MKFQFKGFVAGLLAGLAATTVIAAATPVVRTLENVITEGIRIVIDGKEFTCTDVNGAVVQPMIYNGTTYIPVRAVSTAFGKAVYWDDEEYTVYLGKMDGKLKEPTVKLTDLKNISRGSFYFQTKPNMFDNYGGFYNSASACFGIPEDCCETLLDKKYSKFKATVFVPEGVTWADSDHHITIIGDEKVLYVSEDFGKTSKPMDIEVDVTGINDFKIIFNQKSNVFIANAGFYQ